VSGDHLGRRRAQLRPEGRDQGDQRQRRLGKHAIALRYATLEPGRRQSSAGGEREYKRDREREGVRESIRETERGSERDRERE